MTTLAQENDRQQKRPGRPLLLAIVAGLVLLAAVVIWQLAAPGGMTGEPQADPRPATPQATWAAQNIDSYRFDLEIGCFCIREMTRPVTIEVVDGEVASITYIDDGTQADPLFFEGFATIDQLFERLADQEAQNPVKFDVTYDEALGIPLSADIDVSELMADEELWLTISNFEARP